MARHPLAPRRSRRRRSPAVIGVVAVGLGLLLAGRHAAGSPSAADPGAAASAASVLDPAPTAGATRCGALVAGLSLRDRLAQRLVVGVDASDPRIARDLVRRTHVGGVFLGGNATGVLEASALQDVRDAGPLPALLAVDDEGGRVQRIDGIDGDLPSARVMGTMAPDRVRALAQDRGRELRALGITVDFAPVLDIGGQPDGAVIGDRAFSTDPDAVATHAGAWASGLRASGVIPVFKHFPGHGRARGDSHKTLPTTPPLDSLRSLDLKPYRDLLGTGAAAVMVGHLNVPGLTNGGPASLDQSTYRLLRQEFGFGGVTITDDLAAMRAVSARYDLTAAVQAALEAGADVALTTSSDGIPGVLDDLVRVTGTGALPSSETDAAAARIAALKGLCTP